VGGGGGGGRFSKSEPLGAQLERLKQLRGMRGAGGSSAELKWDGRGSGSGSGVFGAGASGSEDEDDGEDEDEDSGGDDEEEEEESDEDGDGDALAALRTGRPPSGDVGQLGASAAAGVMGDVSGSGSASAFASGSLTELDAASQELVAELQRSRDARRKMEESGIE